LPHESAAPAPLQNVLKEAKLQTFAIAENSSARGRFIRELQLRTQTGASIVAIERHGASIVNPSPDEELQTNDQVLLIGSAAQLEKAQQLLEKKSE
jgi:CPA2 family monovalent cation:H+ antiporter-2